MCIPDAAIRSEKKNHDHICVLQNVLVFFFFTNLFNYHRRIEFQTLFFSFLLFIRTLIPRREMFMRKVSSQEMTTVTTKSENLHNLSAPLDLMKYDNIYQKS